MGFLVVVWLGEIYMYMGRMRKGSVAASEVGDEAEDEGGEGLG